MADSAKARHILIRYQGLSNAPEDVTRSKETAEKLADSLLKVIQLNKGKFEALAAEFSEDTSNKDKGGDLGFFGPGRMVPEFNDFVFDNSAGKVGVVETNFGYHVVEIEEQKNLQKAIKVATVTKEIEASEQTLNTVFSEAANLEEAVRQGDFATIAKEKELDLRPVNRVGKMDANIPGIGSNRAIVTWAFNEDTKVGDVSRFNVPNGYVIAQLTRKNPKGLLSVAEASSRVTPILRNEKKAKQIRASITGTTLDEIAASKNVTIQSATALTRANPIIADAGNEPKVVGATFGKKAGEVTDLIDGKTGVFKVRVMARNNAPDFESYASYANQLTNQARPTLDTSIYNALKNAAEIEDNRAVFY
jgi:peptidylprolyl isomerase/peptidyl-prolyl cis-trans isomerase D